MINKLQKYLKDTRVKRGPEMYSDHSLEKLKLKLGVQQTKNRKQTIESAQK